MVRVACRALTALLLALTIGGAPLVLAQCATTCQLARTPMSAAVAPSCHHSASATPSVGHAPGSCGHDQDGTVAATIASKSEQRSPALTAVLPAMSTAFDARPPRQRVFLVDSTGAPGQRSSSFLSPLRL